jgi:4-diphosphocytidyl-2-C-methyl-D-erythritol kinase
MKINLRTNAKVNLFLRVWGTRPDGYHSVETILHGITLADEIEVETVDSDEVSVEMEAGSDLVGPLPEGENIVTKAIALLGAKTGRSDGARVRITKHIPIGAGLGGGSANAAGVLYALNALWQLSLDADDLVEIAADVGSDVPYCIQGGTALALGRGEQLTPLPVGTEMWFVLGLAQQGLLTRDVYAQWDAEHSLEGSSLRMVLALQAGELPEVASLVHNDLEAAAQRLRPDLVERRSTLLRAGALGACMTGSGPTVFGITTTRAEAEGIARRVEEQFESVLVVSSSGSCIEVIENPVAT